MAYEAFKGQLIAVDGPRGPEVAAAAKRLHRQLGRENSGVSEWGASNLFAEMKLNTGIPGPSPRILILLYATDLKFRLRWEVQPALEQGQTIVAASYVHTAIAFGHAAGLSKRWLVELFDFAIKPRTCYRVKGKDSSGKPADGFLEFCCAALRDTDPPWDLVELRKNFNAYLDALERRRACETFTDKALAAAGSR